MVGGGVNLSVICSIGCDTFCSSRHSHRLFSLQMMICGLTSASPPLLCASTLLLWWVVFVLFLFHSTFPSYCPHRLESLGLTRQVHFAQEWHQETINHFLTLKPPRPPFLFPPHLTRFTAHSLEVIMCFKPRFNPFRRVPKGVWLWLFLFNLFNAQLSDSDRALFLFVFCFLTVCSCRVYNSQCLNCTNSENHPS